MGFKHASVEKLVKEFARDFVCLEGPNRGIFFRVTLNTMNGESPEQGNFPARWNEIPSFTNDCSYLQIECLVKVQFSVEFEGDRIEVFERINSHNFKPVSVFVVDGSTQGTHVQEWLNSTMGPFMEVSPDELGKWSSDIRTLHDSLPLLVQNSVHEPWTALTFDQFQDVVLDVLTHGFDKTSSDLVKRLFSIETVRPIHFRNPFEFRRRLFALKVRFGLSQQSRTLREAIRCLSSRGIEGEAIFNFWLFRASHFWFSSIEDAGFSLSLFSKDGVVLETEMSDLRIAQEFAAKVGQQTLAIPTATTKTEVAELLLRHLHDRDEMTKVSSGLSARYGKTRSIFGSTYFVPNLALRNDLDQMDFFGKCEGFLDELEAALALTAITKRAIWVPGSVRPSNTDC